MYAIPDVSVDAYRLVGTLFYSALDNLFPKISKMASSWWPKYQVPTSPGAGFMSNLNLGSTFRFSASGTR